MTDRRAKRKAPGGRDGKKKASGGGSAGSGGYDFQSRVIAYVSVFMLAGRPLCWTPGEDVPIAISAETGGPGDDLSVELSSGLAIEIQCKKGLTANKEFYEVFRKFAKATIDSSNLWYVLAVDTNASGTIISVKDDLRRIVSNRLDGLSETSKRLIAYLEPVESDAKKALSRSAIIDLAILNDHESGVLLAQEMLSHLLEAPNRVSAAWSYLITIGLRACRTRGRLTIQSVFEDFQRAGFFIKPDDTPSVPAYNTWLAQTTSTFSVPGAPIPLPIEAADIEVGSLADTKIRSGGKIRTLREAIAKYREWERLDSSSSRFNYNDITLLDGNVVILAGAGSGKTTLCSRLANSLCATQSVARVKLPMVAKRLASGTGIDDAIFEVATAGFSGSENSTLRNWLNAPAYLLADGFDECGSQRRIIAEALQSWALSRPNTKIILTSRPIGFDPSLFYDWHHLELLPLEECHIEKFEDRVMELLTSSKSETEDKLQQLRSQFERNEVAAKARKNPLLLGLMIWLSSRDIEFASRRAPLFQQMLSNLPRIHSRIPNLELDRAISNASLDIIGAILQGIEFSNADPTLNVVIDTLGETLCRELDRPQLECSQIAEQCIKYWLDLGVLDHFHGGSDEFLIFSLPSFQEFTAARRLVSRGEERVRAFTDENWSFVKHREVLLLAAGLRYAETMAIAALKSNNYDQDLSTAPVFAASVLAESPSPSAELAQAIAGSLIDRLNSNIPALCYESLAGLLKLPLALLNGIQAKIKPLFCSPQPWTRIAANRINVELDHSTISTTEISKFINNYESYSHQDLRRGFVINDSQKKFRQETLHKGAIIFANRNLLDSVTPSLEKILTSGKASYLTHRTILGLLPSDAKERINSKLASDLAPQLITLAAGFSDREADWKDEISNILALIVESFPESKPVKEISTYAEIRKLLTIIGYWESSIGTGRILASSEDKGSIHFVFLAIAVRYGLNLALLGQEAQAALIDLKTAPIYNFLDKIEQTPEIRPKKGPSQNLSPKLLAKALAHRSELIAVAAANLIILGDSSTGLATSCEPLLSAKYDHTIRIVAAISSQIWNDKALEIIIKNLSKETYISSDRWLFESIPELQFINENIELDHILENGLTFGNPELADGICTSLDRYPRKISDRLIPVLERSFNFWEHRKMFCSKCKIDVDYSCPRCHLVFKTPLSKLALHLANREKLPVEKLLELLTHPHYDVSKAASSALVTQLNKNPDLLKELISKKISSYEVLDVILSINGDLISQFQDKLLQYIDDPNPHFRLRLTEAISSADWIDERRAINLARQRLSDDEPSVRNRALLTLRSLSAVLQIASTVPN